MTALSDPAEILDPEKLAAEDSPARRTMRQEILDETLSMVR
jgi:hypothetical protein